MPPPFRLAFIGIDHPHGAGWRKALLNLGDAVQITAIVPRFGGATASLEERNAAAPRFETVDELIRMGDFDGAIVCLPNNESVAALAALAAAGKHIVAEKPMAASAGDARRALEAVQAAGVAFQTGYMWRYDAGANRLRDMVRDGRFGKLISVEMAYVTSNVARRGPDHYLFNRETSGGGFFNWLACHWLDLLLYMTGQTVVGVTARVGVYGATPSEVEDGGVAILDLSGGGIATFLGGYWLPRWMGETHWSLRGRDRWVHWHPSRAGTSGVLEIHGPQPQFDAMEETFALPEDKTPGYGGSRAVALLTDWLEAAASGGRLCRNTPQSTLATLELIDTIYQSSREGRRIECAIGGS
jgi:predicted dehydrogenase